MADQQVTQFQPTFSPAQQGLGSIQPYQAPDTPAMESTPQDYSQSPQYAPTQQYGAPTQQYDAPAASPMTAGLGSYMEGLQYKAPPPPPAVPAARNYSWNSGKYADEAALRGALGTYATQNNYTPASVDTWMGDQATYGISSTPAAAPSTTTAYNPQTQQYTAPVEPAAPAQTAQEIAYQKFKAEQDEINAIMSTQGGSAAGGRIHAYAQGGSIPQGIASLGRGQDSMLVHMTPGEVQGLQRLAMAHGGSLTINPQTGLPEAGFLSSMLPMLAAAAAIAVTGGAATPLVAGAGGAAATGGTFMGLAPAVWGAGAGALTGALTNKQSPLMGAVMGGISGYGMGSIGEGLSNLGADLVGPETAKAAELAGQQAYENTLKEATANQAAAQEASAIVASPPPTFSPPAQVAAAAQRQAIDTAADTFRLPTQNNMMAGLQGLSSEQGRNAFIGQTAKDSVTGKATGLGGGLAATAKGLGLAAPLISSALTPNKFVPPPVKPPTFYNTSYQPPKYNPATGMYDPASYGPGSNSTVYGAEGGAVGYAKGDLVAEAYYGEGVTTGGPGNPGKEPERSRNIYGDEDVRVSQGMPYSDAGGIHSNIKPNKNTPAKQVLAAYKAAKKAKGLRALLGGEDDDIEYAAEGGLMGVNTYAAGGKLLRGPGDGMSDSIPAVIQGAKPQRAALADGEFVVPADVVSHLGNGSTEAGSRQLYAMMNKIRKARTGNPKQGKQINPARFMPA